MTGEKGARMREIKFRQPILVRGKFGYWHYWGFLSEGQFASPETKQSSINKAKETSQQFTGIHDRNGREIYEGDILRGTSEKIRIRDNKRTGEYVTKTVTIEWQDEWGRFQLKNTSGNFELLPCTKQDWIAEFYEVIGNIFENPELCKG